MREIELCIKEQIQETLFRIKGLKISEGDIEVKGNEEIGYAVFIENKRVSNYRNYSNVRDEDKSTYILTLFLWSMQYKYEKELRDYEEEIK